MALQLSGTMSSANLGVSGPRGAGKTTLLRNFCDASLSWRRDSRTRPGLIPDLRVMVSAPVDYDTREFILHLFGRLCETILATGRASAGSHTSRWGRIRLKRNAWELRAGRGCQAPVSACRRRMAAEVR